MPYLSSFSMMESSERKFLWYVYGSGTHFIWLEGTEEEIHSQNDWFEAIRQQKSNGVDVDPRHHMFIVDRSAGTLKQVKRYTDIEFKVLEPAAC
ncbi:hypothetical protein [Paenibacillus sp. Y412MC10]|uniref:hypothetical protein n=1 Tax=Geobacillus sp. (strain Y412MC10) TaxID=481743 RepID=UPI0011AB7056|nr:hypothetical protein [Paenibacillus sp. Y412MC10]